MEPASWSALLESMRPAVSSAKTLEDAAQLVAQRVYEMLPQSTALARIYALIPQKELPQDVRTFVEKLAVSTNQADSISGSTPVLSLLGTYGAQDAWRDRTQSQGHKGIPLVSRAFVDAIPMLARLLRELGIALEWLDDAPEIMTRKLLGGFNGVFYVEDAKTVRDVKGRLVIPATDFVEAEKVKTVFGMGGFYPDGTMIVCILFTREALPKATVERLTSLISMMKGDTFRVVRERRFFRTDRALI